MDSAHENTTSADGSCQSQCRRRRRRPGHVPSSWASAVAAALVAATFPFSPQPFGSALLHSTSAASYRGHLHVLAPSTLWYCGYGREICGKSTHSSTTAPFLAKMSSGSEADTLPLTVPSESQSASNVPELDAWRMIMDKGAEFFHNTTAPLGQEPGTANVVDVGMTDLFEMLRAEDEAAIEVFWQRLHPALEYLSPAKQKKVLLGLKVAYVAHIDQKRKSGEPFIIHPVAVAELLADMRMDCDTVVAGLLHDTVEDTDLTFTQVETFFGRTVRHIVEGETKVSKLPKIALGAYADEQAENLRQMFIAMTEDYRIIIVKLADRLHNMRTLRHMSPEKQKKISRETLDIFAPLAHRLGIWQVKSELEDIAFRYLYPREYSKLKKRLRMRMWRYRRALDQSKDVLEQKISEDKMLTDQAVTVNVTGRMKELYSLWTKMETKYERKLDRIRDVVALRVVLEIEKRPRESPEEWRTRGIWLCYHVLGLVQHLPGCQPMPSQVKDYISMPKPNGYQSLHTAIMREGQVVEVQIRTGWMHRVAEYGMASHWLYKEQQQLSQGSGAMPKPYRIPWLTCITDWQHEIKSSREFVEAIRRELLGQRVFVFLRDGKILNLSRGAAVIDAAFQIHTEVGLSMTGATINGQPAPFDYELRNGDVVSIQTSSIDEASPKPEWLRYATSRSTRAKLRQYFKTVQRDTLIDVGHTILDDFLRQQREVIVQHLGAVPEKATLMRHVRTRSPEDSMEDFCMHLAHSDDRDVANLMSKVLNIPAEAFVDLPAMNDVQWAASSSTHSGTSPTPQAPVDAFIPAGNEPAGTSSTRSKWGPGVGFMDDVDQGPHTEEKGISIPAMLPPPPHIGGGGAPAASSQLLGSATDRTGGDDVEPIVYAEPEMLCQFCMPVRGDEVSGTVELNGEMTAHRRGCPEAELQLLAQRRGSRTRGGRLSGAQQQVQAPLARVPLRWPPTDRKGVLYTVDITVYCRDRKLLLSDVSNVVSKGSIIASTASKTHGRDATLSFSIMVRDLEQLQLLLDSLSQVESVMTCERAFGR